MSVLKIQFRAGDQAALISVKRAARQAPPLSRLPPPPPRPPIGITKEEGAPRGAEPEETWHELAPAHVASQKKLLAFFKDISTGEDKVYVWCFGPQWRKLLNILDVEDPLPKKPVPWPKEQRPPRRPSKKAR